MLEDDLREALTFDDVLLVHATSMSARASRRRSRCACRW